ncbi:MAG TPA: DUF4912 domain-containing protein [Blastocatellia bacterium]|nr:DUF4912 domain-containing protein [Blastocatellia bacterium]
MFVLRPSSPLRTFQPERAPQPVEPIEITLLADIEAPAEPYIDPGLPVPEDYDVDIIRALLQDPFRIFIYWEVREESLAALTRYFSAEDATRFRTVLKLRDVEGGQEPLFEVGRRGRYWMMVFPDREYEFEIGVHSPAHGYIMLVRSNRVRTPRGTVSPVPPQEDRYRMSPPEFVQVMEASGFGAQQALGITVAAMPGAHAEAEPLTAALTKLPDAVRTAVLVAGAGGELTYQMIEELPEPLRSELLKLWFASGGQITAAGLMHYLPELLREAIEDERELIGDHVHPLHVAPRFFVGASENAAWPGQEFQLPALPQGRVPGSLSPVSSWTLKGM